MARPREFDIDEAIGNAMLVFWRNGYEEAGLTELCAAMGVTRGSFYKAFGSKSAFFLTVLERYKRENVAEALAFLADGDGPGIERIKAMFQSGLEAARSGDVRGCLLCNTASGPALADSAIRAAISAQMARITEAFAAALSDVNGLAHVSDDRRLAEARRLTISYVGLRIQGRGAFDPASLDDAVHQLFAA